jgi:Tfp pilus assembly protein PilF
MSRGVLAGLLCAMLAVAQSGSDNDVLQRAVSLHQSGDYTGAIDGYEQFLKAHPEAAGVRSNLGAALAHEGRFEDAIREYRLALDAEPAGSPASLKVRLNLALAYFKTAQIAKAAEELAKVHEAEPANQQATLLLATCYLRQGENKKVISLLDPLWQPASARENGGDPAIAYLLGSALIRDVQVNRGQVILDRILRNGDSAEARLLMGTTKFMAKEFASARTDLERAVQLNPKLPEANSYLGLVLLSTGDAAGAEQAFRRELDLDPNDFTANLQLGGLLRQDHNYNEARVLLERALRIRTGDYGARYQLASADLAEGRIPAAQAKLESLVKDAPSFVQAHVTLATIYYREKRKDEGDREREIVRKLNADLQAKQPGAQTPSADKAPETQDR